MITHKHHIVPKHAGGTDDPSNLVELTVEEHAEAHRKLYEQYGRWQDKLAWMGLSNNTKPDLHLQAIREGIRNRDNSYMRDPERCRKISESNKKPKSESQKQNMRKPKSVDHARKLNNVLNARAECPHCDYESTRGAVTRHIKRHHNV